MKKIAKLFLVLIAVLALVYFFAIDIVIKAVIERQATQALRARVDIAGATFHLLPTSLTLRGVQITNPQQPTSNLLQADVASAPLQFGELFERRLIIDTMQLRGLRFAQQRAQSGAIDGLTPVPPAAATVQNSTMDHPQARQRGDIDAARQELTTLRNNWQQRLRTLPTSEQLGDYHFRAQGKDAANRSRLRSEIGDELATVRKLQEEFAFDFERIKPQLNLSGIPQTAAVQLPGGTPVSITGALLRRELTPVLRNLLGFVPTATIQNEDLGQWQILVRKAVVDGEINLGASPLRLTGTVENITPQPRRFDAVTTFQLQSTPEQTGTFSASGSIDLRKLPLQNIRFNLAGFPVSKLPLSTDDALRISITNAIADIQGLLALTGNQIDINMLARFQNAELDIAAGDSPISRAAANTLRSARDFDLNFQASGNVADPVLTLNSSLDKLLASAVNQELNAVAAGGAAPETQALRQLGAELLQIQQTLLATQTTLQSLLDL